MLEYAEPHPSLKVYETLMGTGRRAVIFLTGVFPDNVPVNNLPLPHVQATLIKLSRSKTKKKIKKTSK